MFNNPKPPTPAFGVKDPNDKSPKVPPSAPKTSLEAPKENATMLTSITVPVLTNNKTPTFKDAQNAKEEKKEDLHVGFAEDKNKVLGQKTGGTLSGPADPRRNGENGPKAREPERIDRQVESMTTLMDKLFLLQKITNNEDIKDSQVEAFVENFGALTGSKAQNKSNLDKLSKKQLREKIFSTIKYLSKEKDEKVLEQIRADLAILVKKLLDKYPYLTPEACVRLIEYYIRLNENTYYPNGKFQYKKLKEQNGIHFQLSKKIISIIRQIQDIKANFFYHYERTLELLLEKKNNKERCPLLIIISRSEGLRKKMNENIWKTFNNILQYQKEARKSSGICGFELNIMLSCLSCSFSIFSSCFDKNKVLNEIFPALRSAIYLFKADNSASLPIIDECILHLLLVHPFNIANLNASKELNDFIKADKIRQRYPYLLLLLDQNVEPEYFRPLESTQTAIFLENYIKMNQDFDNFEPSKQAFIFNSICSIFKSRPPHAKLNKALYPKLFGYISYTIRSIFPQFLNEGQSRELSRQQYGEEPPYLAVCRLAKLISSLCLSSQKEGISGYRLSELTENNGLVVWEILRTALQLIRQHPQDNSEINRELEIYQLDTELVYQMFFRLLLHDPNYFVQKEALVIECFSSLSDFYVHLFTSHITKYLEVSQFLHLNLLALASMVTTGGMFEVCNMIFQELGTLEDNQIELQDLQGRKAKLTQLQFAAKKVVQFQGKEVNTFTSVAHLVLSILHHQPIFLQTAWISALNKEVRRMIDTYHPIIMSKYAETLTHVLAYLRSTPSPQALLQPIQTFFDFKFIPVYLCSVFAFQTDPAEPSDCKVFNKYMRARRYSEIKLAVKLLEEMSGLYLKEKEEAQQGQRVPLEVRRMIETENKGGSYQLLWQKEACSYVVGLIIVVLSRQFALDQYLRKKQTKLRDHIYSALTNLTLIASLLKYQLPLKINHLYSRHSQLTLNDSLSLKSSLLQLLKWNPTYKSLQYMMSWSQFRHDLKRQLFEKVRRNEEKAKKGIEGVEERSWFVRVYWRQINKKVVRVSNMDQAWEYTDSFMKQLELKPIQNQLQAQPEVASRILQNILSTSILIKKTSLKTYSSWLHQYYYFLLQYRPKKQQQLSPVFFQAILYFFNLRSLLAPAEFQFFRREPRMMRNVYLFLMSLLKGYKKGRQVGKRGVIEVVLNGVGFLMQAGGDQSQFPLKEWLQDILRQVMLTKPLSGQVTTQQILLVFLLKARLGQQLSFSQLSFSNHHWLLLPNVTQLSPKLSQLLMCQLPSLTKQHPVFFLSSMHYFHSLASNVQQMSFLNSSVNLHIKKNFIQAICTLLHKLIKEQQSIQHNSGEQQQYRHYHIIWCLAVLGQIVMLEEQSNAQDAADAHHLYNQVRTHIVSSQVVSHRIAYLWQTLAYSAGVNEMPGIWGHKQHQQHKQDTKLTLGSKLELLAYIRLLVLIHYSPRHPSSSRHQNHEEAQLQQAQNQIFLAMLALPSLLSKLLTSKTRVSPTTALEKTLSLLQLDRLLTRNVAQSGLREYSQMEVHQLWSKGTTALDLLSQAADYQLVSLCCLWMSQVVKGEDGQFSLHPQLPQQQEPLDKILLSLISLMDSTSRRLQLYHKLSNTIAPLLSTFQKTIYTSLPLSKQFLFTNSNSLNCSLHFTYDHITQQLGQVVVTLHRVLEQVFSQVSRGAIKTKAAHSFKQKERNLKPVQVILKNIDVSFSVGDKSTHRHESEFMSNRRTRTIHL